MTLDPDTEQMVRARMKAKGVSFKRALNDAIREGAQHKTRSAFDTPTFDTGELLVDITHTSRVLLDLDLAEFQSKEARSR